MAQMLQKGDSPAKAERAARRHLRLAKRTGNAEALALAERIRSPMADLVRTIDDAGKARDAAQDAFDDWNQDDQALDSAVRSVHRKLLDWDADHAAAGTVQMMLAGRTVGEIVGTRREKEPDLVAAMVQRGTKLPAGHPAMALLEGLTRRADASRSGHRAWVDALQAATVADAAADGARLTVIRAYRDNMIDIERACGPAVMEACFPTLRHAPTATEEDDAAEPGPTGSST